MANSTECHGSLFEVRYGIGINDIIAPRWDAELVQSPSIFAKATIGEMLW